MLKKLFLNNIVIMLFAVIFWIPFQLSYADSVTVNIPNSQGGYTAIVIQESDNGYVGPNGERYSQFPTVSQLQAAYDAGTSDSIVAAIAQSNDVQSVGTPISTVQNSQPVSQITIQQIGEWASQGWSSKEIISRIKATDTVYSLTTDDYYYLKGQGVSDSVITAMRRQSGHVWRKKHEQELLRWKKEQQEEQERLRQQQVAQRQAAQQQATLVTTPVTQEQAVQNVVPSVAQTIPTQADQSNVAPQIDKGVSGPMGAGTVTIIFTAILFVIGLIIYTCDQAFRGQAILFYNWPDAIGTAFFSIIMFLGFRQIYSNDGNYVFGVVEVIGALAFNFYMANKFYKGNHLQQIFINLSRVGVSVILPMAYLFTYCFWVKGLNSLHNQVKNFMNRVVYGHIILEWKEANKNVNVKKKTPNEILGVNVKDPLDRIEIVYKNLLMEYQPDRFVGWDPHIIDFVNQKAREINSAYENIMRARGI